MAVIRGNVIIVRALLAAGADPDAHNAITIGSGDTPLHSAVRSGHIMLVQTLLDAGSAVDPINGACVRVPHNMLDALDSLKRVGF
jgi:ankyrin repeat protein